MICSIVQSTDNVAMTPLVHSLASVGHVYLGTLSTNQKKHNAAIETHNITNEKCKNVM